MRATQRHLGGSRWRVELTAREDAGSSRYQRRNYDPLRGKSSMAAA
jgi:hypothetical protein